MLDRAEQLGIEPCYTRQILSVYAITLMLVLVDQPQLARVGHDDLMTQTGE